jgi:hypothetical protein
MTTTLSEEEKHKLGVAIDDNVEGELSFDGFCDVIDAIADARADAAVEKVLLAILGRIAPLLTMGQLFDLRKLLAAALEALAGEGSK